ncbi:serine/threonine-protein kinase haspin homolog isoform X2 [Salvia miltiorrhiza]|uniref:serine/threonine-protein kinase haspin homolog isoform X2 n=1 Tax=Salvia miltiorrhiza TaxID=226208 RepID=UPI0025AC6263|nr:serine/threonine-protein kinase haspin homolog isoform X2 [Salvia miltiorrhiza]
MASRTVDLWDEVVAEEEEKHQRSVGDWEPAIVYRRQKADVKKDLPRRQSNSGSGDGSRKSFAPVKRVSWNRSLSTRGRTSIAANACVDQPKHGKARRNAKPPLPRGKGVEPPNYNKERAYFQEVDAFELLEESPSPKKPSTWTMGTQVDEVVIPHLSSVFRKWLMSKKLNQTYAFPGSLSKILETPVSSSTIKTPAEEYLGVQLNLDSTQQRRISSLSDKPSSSMPIEDACEDIEVAVSKLSLTSGQSSLDGHGWDSFSALLNACGQSIPSTLTDMLSNYCEGEAITKVGEGTYGEAFKIGDKVCKIVPFGGDSLVNGEVQKKPEELLEEVVLSCTLNHLRGLEADVSNACTSFIQTINLRVCQGCYDFNLIRAWDDWDAKNNSENDNPKEFSSDQCYVVFVQEHGGRDLESFVLLNFDEARSLLVQVTLALAVAEAAYEFEHRDLHWGNVLLTRKESAALLFILDGKKLLIKTFGLVASIIDFTLSRMNTGEDILFLDLSSDPELFEGPKRDIQADTYRKMRDVTDECWEGSFPKTNVLWIQYLVDILRLKKSFERTSKDERELRSLKKRLNTYGSAKECVYDPFFSDLFIKESSSS